MGPVEYETVFHIQKALLAQYSGYFRDDVTSDDATVEELQYITRSSFGVFVDWLYRQALPEVSDWYTHYKADDAETLLELVIFSQNFHIPKFENDLLRVAVSYYNSRNRAPSVELVSEALEYLPDSSRYLDLLADAFCLFWSKENEAELERSPPDDFLHQVAMRFFESFNRRRLNDCLQLDDYVK